MPPRPWFTVGPSFNCHNNKGSKGLVTDKNRKYFERKKKQIQAKKKKLKIQEKKKFKSCLKICSEYV
jgi:hypothetical protein